MPLIDWPFPHLCEGDDRVHIPGLVKCQHHDLWKVWSGLNETVMGGGEVRSARGAWEEPRRTPWGRHLASHLGQKTGQKLFRQESLRKSRSDFIQDLNMLPIISSPCSSINSLVSL